MFKLNVYILVSKHYWYILIDMLLFSSLVMYWHRLLEIWTRQKILQRPLKIVTIRAPFGKQEKLYLSKLSFNFFSIKIYFMKKYISRKRGGEWEERKVHFLPHNAFSQCMQGKCIFSHNHQFLVWVCGTPAKNLPVLGRIIHEQDTNVRLS